MGLWLNKSKRECLKLKLFRYKSSLTAKSLLRESQVWTPEKCEHLDLFQKSSFAHSQVCLDWVYNLRVSFVNVHVTL